STRFLRRCMGRGVVGKTRSAERTDSDYAAAPERNYGRGETSSRITWSHAHRFLFDGAEHGSARSFGVLHAGRCLGSVAGRARGFTWLQQVHGLRNGEAHDFRRIER